MKGFEHCRVVSITSTEAITAKRFVAYDGTHTVNLRAVGVAMDDCDSGDEISVACGGIAVVEAGAAVTAGDLVESDANGKAITLTPTITNPTTLLADLKKICGRALDTATAAGEFIRVLQGGI